MVSGDPHYFPAFGGAEPRPLGARDQRVAQHHRGEHRRVLRAVHRAAGAPRPPAQPEEHAARPEAIALRRRASDHHPPELHADHLEVSLFVGIARDLYVDNEPHELMTREDCPHLDNVLPAAESGKLEPADDGARRENVHSHLAAPPFTPRPRALFTGAGYRVGAVQRPQVVHRRIRLDGQRRQPVLQPDGHSDQGEQNGAPALTAALPPHPGWLLPGEGPGRGAADADPAARRPRRQGARDSKTRPRGECSRQQSNAAPAPRSPPLSLLFTPESLSTRTTIPPLRQPTSHHTPRYHTGGPPRGREAFERYRAKKRCTPTRWS